MACSGANLLGQQAELVHAGGANFVDGLDDVAVLRARIGADEDGLVEAIGDQVLHLGGDIVKPNLRCCPGTFCRRG